MIHIVFFFSFLYFDLFRSVHDLLLFERFHIEMGETALVKISHKFDDLTYACFSTSPSNEQRTSNVYSVTVRTESAWNGCIRLSRGLVYTTSPGQDTSFPHFLPFIVYRLVSSHFLTSKLWGCFSYGDAPIMESYDTPIASSVWRKVKGTSTELELQYQRGTLASQQVYGYDTRRKITSKETSRLKFECNMSSIICY
jgi:hypothetical protein